MVKWLGKLLTKHSEKKNIIKLDFVKPDVVSTDKAKITISLYGMVGTGIIIPYPCGVFYGNQTGGVNCDHPEIEGVFLPFSTDPNEKKRSSSVPSY